MIWVIVTLQIVLTRALIFEAFHGVTLIDRHHHLFELQCKIISKQVIQNYNVK